MLNRKTLTAIALVVAGVSGPVLADDADVPRAKLALEQARNFGVSQPAGQAAGEIDQERERHQRNTPQVMNANEKLWQLTSRHRSGN